MKQNFDRMAFLVVLLFSTAGFPCSEPEEREIPKECIGHTDAFVRTFTDVDTDLPKDLISISPEKIEIKNSGEDALYWLGSEAPIEASNKNKNLYKVKDQNLYRIRRLQSDIFCPAANESVHENNYKALWYCLGDTDTCGKPLEPSSILFESGNYSYLDKDFKKQTKDHPLLTIENKYQYKEQILKLKFHIHLEKNKAFRKKCEKYN